MGWKSSTGEPIRSPAGSIVRVEPAALRGPPAEILRGCRDRDRSAIELPRGAYFPAFAAKLLRRHRSRARASAPEPGFCAACQAILARHCRERPHRDWSRAFLVRPPLLLPRRFTNFTRVTNEQARCTNPTLSPDGRTIVYARRDEAVGTIPEDTREPGDQELNARFQSHNTQPAFSPRRPAESRFGANGKAAASSLWISPAAPSGGSSTPVTIPRGRRMGIGSLFLRAPSQIPPRTRSAAQPLADCRRARKPLDPLCLPERLRGPSTRMVAQRSPHRLLGTGRQRHPDIWTIPAEGDASAKLVPQHTTFGPTGVPPGPRRPVPLLFERSRRIDEPLGSDR